MSLSSSPIQVCLFLSHASHILPHSAQPSASLSNPSMLPVGVVLLQPWSHIWMAQDSVMLSSWNGSPFNHSQGKCGLLCHVILMSDPGLNHVRTDVVLVHDDIDHCLPFSLSNTLFFLPVLFTDLSNRPCVQWTLVLILCPHRAWLG